MQQQTALGFLSGDNPRFLCVAIRQHIHTAPHCHGVGQVPPAAEVLPKARESSADVLILDLTLQGGSGLPLIEELTTAMPELRVIVFSGVANSDEVSREAKRRGAAEYVSKGCDIQILFKALRTGATAS